MFSNNELCIIIKGSLSGNKANIVDYVWQVASYSEKEKKGVDNFVWTFLYPGCHIYQWQTTSPNSSRGADCSSADPHGFGRRKMRSKLDCSKLVPSSESLATIAIDEHFSPGRCQVASMCVLAGKLYAGTNWGCLIVVDAAAMRPIAVFRPFSEEIQAVVALKEDQQQQRQPLLVTLGKGYRSLTHRFCPRRNKAIKGDDEDDDFSMNLSALLWRPDDWLAV